LLPRCVKFHATTGHRAQDGGIPQTVAALHMHGQAMVGRVLSLRIDIGTVLLTLLGLASGASIGREIPRLELQRDLIPAGSVAGIAAAFNTPLAGIVFAIDQASIEEHPAVSQAG